MSVCNHHLQVNDFALTSNNSQLLDDVAKCMDTMSRIQQARAAKATVYHDAIFKMYIYAYIYIYIYILYFIFLKLGGGGGNLCMQIYL